MCTQACIEFGRLQLKEEDIRGKSVIEVGSLDVNGSLRPIVEALGPGSYLGVDVQTGPGVDLICDANDLLDRFGPERFDVVISCELLEHVRDWRLVINNIKRILAPDGVMLITTRSEGFRFHGYPFDFWRYEPSDMEAIFSDCIIEALEKDPLAPGVFIRARKPRTFVENDLRSHRLYSILRRKRTITVRDRDISWFKVRNAILRFPSREVRTTLRRMVGIRVAK